MHQATWEFVDRIYPGGAGYVVCRLENGSVLFFLYPSCRDAHAHTLCSFGCVLAGEAGSVFTCLARSGRKTVAMR